MITVVGPPSPLDLSVEEFLARLKRDRRGTLDALQQRPWRLTALHVDPSEFWELFDETGARRRHGRPVGLRHARRRASVVHPRGSRPLRAVVAMCLSVYAASDEMSVTMATAQDGVVTIRASTSPAANNEQKR